MATKICVCCGKKLGLMTGSRHLLENSDSEICDSCYYKFSTPLNVFMAKDSLGAAEESYNVLIENISSYGYSQEGNLYVTTYINSQKNEKIKSLKEQQEREYQEQREQIQKQERQKEYQKRQQEIQENIDQLRNEFLMTTGFNFEGYDIITYLGIQSGSVVRGTGIFSETSAAISDFFGEENSAFSSKLEITKEAAINQLRDKAIHIGANAIIGVDFDYVTFSSNMIGVIVTGTAVVVRKKA